MFEAVRKNCLFWFLQTNLFIHSLYNIIIFAATANASVHKVIVQNLAHAKTVLTDPNTTNLFMGQLKKPYFAIRRHLLQKLLNIQKVHLDIEKDASAKIQNVHRSIVNAIR